MHEIIDRLISKGYDVYFVGGAVRDMLAGYPVDDIDILTNASIPYISELFSDRSLKLVKGVMLIDGIEVDTFDDIEYNLNHRDLTINAIAQDCKTGNLVDPLNGRADIEQKIIRFVGDPYERIIEDPCRIVRACRFFAKMEGVFDKDSLDIMTDTAEMVNSVHKDRIRKEIMKAMELRYPSLFFSALHLIGALKYIFPSMDKCFNHTHGLHHKESISEHIMLAGDNLSPRDPILRLAGYLHDVGKPEAYIHDGKVGTFKGHEKYGSDSVRRELKDLFFSNEDINRISNLVLVHMRQCRSLKDKAARRLRKTFADLGVDPRDFLRIKLAERVANLRNDANLMSMIKPMLTNTGVISKNEDGVFSISDLALTGGEIINKLNLLPGPKVGKIQRHLLNFVIDNGFNNNKKQILLNEALRYIEVEND